MKTEMKKNKKALFAMMMVAALAMVSFAGIALQSDDTAAADLSVGIGDGTTSPTVIRNSSVDAEFYLNVNQLNEWGVQYVNIESGLTVTGTISVGLANADGTDFVEYGSIKLNGVSNTVFTILFFNFESTGPVVIILAGDEYVFNSSTGLITDYREATGSIEIVSGALAAGAIRSEYGMQMSATDWETLMTGFDNATNFWDFYGVFNDIVSFDDGKIAQYSGSFVAGNSTVSFDYMMGLIVGVQDDGVMAISGYVESDDGYMLLDASSNPVVDREDRFLTFESGEFSVAYADVLENMFIGKAIAADVYFVTENINTVIEDGVYVAVGDNLPQLADVEIKVKSDTAHVFIQNVDTGNVIEGAYDTNPGDADGYFTYNIPNAKTNQEYNLFILDGSDAYFGQLMVTESSVVVYANNLTAMDISGNLDSTTISGSIVYETTDFSSIVVAVGYNGTDYTNLTSSVVQGSSTSRQIDANGMSDVYLVFRQNAAGSAYVAYFGPAIISSASSGVIANSDVKGGNVNLKDIVTNYWIFNPAISQTEGVLTIRGTLEFVFENGSSPEVYGTAQFNNVKISIEDEGMIIYGVTPARSPAPPMPTAPNVEFAAAYFFINEGTGILPDSSTYYYTTLEKAITMHNTITITGEYTILEDITLVSEDGSNLTIFIDAGAKLNIGRKAVPASDIEAASPVVTIPSSTEIRKTGNAEYDVVNGQAVYDVKPSDQNKPESDVLISGDKFIYTDVATGLDISVSGNVLTLLRSATLSRNAEVKSGVELFDTAIFGLTIADEVTLTVNGKFTSVGSGGILPSPATSGSLIIYGTLRVNGELIIKNASSPSTPAEAWFGEGGSIDITSNGVLTISGSSEIIGNDGIGTINVAGKIDLRNSSKVSAGTIQISGEALINGSAMLKAFDELFIGATPELSTGYTNTASITGIIELDSDAMVYAYGNFVVSNTGSGQNVDFGASSIMKSVKYMIGDNLYVTIYAESASGNEIKMLFEDQLKDIIIINWWNDRQLRNLDLRNESPVLIGDSDWPTVYAEFEYRMYDVTFSYLQGMTWVVNGENLNGGVTKSFRYGESITVTGVVQPGFEGTPVLRVNGNSYTAGTSFIVLDNAVFTATGIQQASGGGGDDGNGGMTLIEYLLIVIVVIIAVIAIIVAIRLLRS